MLTNHTIDSLATSSLHHYTFMITFTTVSQHTELAYKDAIYFSGHKFVGGVGCPGILVVKKAVLPQFCDAPNNPGGGTVFYVTGDDHRYLSNREEREESG
jgi:selenocysteine lyase/cysteine desulfurase